MIDGGIVGVGYVCGCESEFHEELKRWVPKFCSNTEHRAYPCGCYNIAGDAVTCIRHLLLRFAAIAAAALLLGFSAYRLLF